MKNSFTVTTAKKTLVFFGFLLAVVALFLSLSTPAHALPPFTYSDLERLYVTENYRDEGRTRTIGCRTGEFSDPGANAQAVWEFFADKLPAHQIAGIIGNMQHESGVNPQRLETVFDKTVPAEQLRIEAQRAFANLSADARASRARQAERQGIPDYEMMGWGIVQWTPYSKLTNSFDTITDANLLINQLNFLWDQLEGRGPAPEGSAGAALKATTTVEEATRVFAEQYERPAASALASSINKRIEDANGALVRFSAIPTVDAPVNSEDGAGSTTQSFASSCADSSNGDGSVASVAEEQLITGGATFKRDVRGGNAADFVSWTFRQAGVPLSGGTEDGGWRYSSVTALQEFFQNTSGYEYFPVGAKDPIPGDVAFFIDPENGIEYAAIVIKVSGDQMTTVGADGSGNVSSATQTIAVGENGLVGFGRADSQIPPGEQSPGAGNNGAVIGLDNPAGLNHTCGGEDLSAISASRLDGLASGKYRAFHSDCFTEVVARADNGTNPQGQFRLICTVSHFAYDDPIIFPDQPGASHLHMFWGNTRANASTDFDRADRSNNLLESGGSSCQGGPLNRSAYWTPAMLAGPDENQVVMPKVITLYYKSYRPWEAQVLPQGIQLLIGNVNRGGSVNSSFSANQNLHWGCYDGSQARRLTNTIPGTNGSAPCPDGQDIQASIQFPQCIAVSSNGSPVLTHSNFIDHTRLVNNNDQCPSSHPYRVPQISYLIRWANPPGNGEASWRLSSDAGFDQPTVQSPGGSLHGDWLGGWYDPAIQAWMDGCFRVSTGPGSPGRNCSIGQTGQNGTNRSFRRITGTNMNGNLMEYNGPQILSFTTDGSGNVVGDSGNTPNGDTKEILVMTKTSVFRHPSIPAGRSMLQNIANRNGFSLTFTEDSSIFTDPNSTSLYDAVIFLNTDSVVFENNTEKQAFRNFIESGKGFVGIHGASATHWNTDKWDWYRNMLGQRFTRHPAVQRATVSVVDRNHQSTAHLPANWVITDEWYDYEARPSNVNVLLTVDENSYSGGGMGNPHPIAWNHTFGPRNSKVWYTGIGHESSHYTDPNYVKHVEEGIKWVVGASSIASSPAVGCGNKKVVNVSPSSNLNNLVNSGGNETACFRLANGDYRFGNIRPKNNQTFIGESSSGVRVNGSGFENAFHGTASNVSISNFTLYNFNSLAGQKAQEQAPIRGTNRIWEANFASNWVIENMVIHSNPAAGIFVGNDFTVRNNVIYNNGVTGIGGDEFRGGLVEGNRVYNNGTNEAGGQYVNGGGMKFTQVDGSSRRLVIRGNEVYNNKRGIWCDVDCNGVTIENNNVHDNTNTGIFYEISRNAIIRNNTLTNSNTYSLWNRAWNSGAISSGESADVTIEGNTINGGVVAIVVRGTLRPAAGESYLVNRINSGKYLNTTARNITVRNNRINGSQSIGANHESIAGHKMDYGSIRFTGNTYSNPGNMTFWWQRSSMNYSQWQSAGRQ